MSRLSMSAAEYEAHQRKRGKLGSSKYKNEPTWIDGIRFDSKKEAKRWQELKLLESASQIFNLHRQVRYPLEINGFKVCDYVADFAYTKQVLILPVEIVEDCKGYRTQIYKLKKKLMLAVYGIEILEI